MDHRRNTHLLVDRIDTQLDLKLDRAERGAAPIVQAQADMGKSVITLSLAALAFTLTVTQYVSPKDAHAVATVLLPASWVMFCFAAICGVIRQGFAGEAQSQRAHLEQRRGAILREIAAIVSETDAEAQATAIISRALAEAAKPAANASRRHDALNNWMLAGFVGGIVAFLLFAMANIKL
jgi:hypothetical protein